MQEPSKDYIREFGEDQSKKKLPVKFEPHTEWDFEPPLKQAPVPQKPTTILPGQEPGADDQIGFTAEEGYENRPITYFDPKTKQNRPANWVTKVSKPQIPKPEKKGIKETELKEMVSSAVLHMMNAPAPSSLLSELTDHQKKEIEERILKIRHRPGIMSIALKEDFDADECSVRALIDPTNRKNWMQIKEETLYKLPYDFKEALHEFASKIWKSSQDQI